MKPSQKRNVVLYAWVTPKSKEWVHKEAKKAGVSASCFLNDLIDFERISHFKEK